MSPIERFEARARDIWLSKQPAAERARRLRRIKEAADAYFLRNAGLPSRLEERDPWAARSVARALRYLSSLSRDLQAMAERLESSARSSLR